MKYFLEKFIIIIYSYYSFISCNSGYNYEYKLGVNKIISCNEKPIIGFGFKKVPTESYWLYEKDTSNLCIVKKVPKYKGSEKFNLLSENEGYIWYKIDQDFVNKEISEYGFISNFDFMYKKSNIIPIAIEPNSYYLLGDLESGGHRPPVNILLKTNEKGEIIMAISTSPCK